ncbi:MAG: hypothetical protein ACTSRP_26040 [Candidatus Helarchaeota archaeon]
MSSFFYAKTRLGDYTENVIVLDEEEFNNKFSKYFRRLENEIPKRPTKKILFKLLLRSVAIPKWWLKLIYRGLKKYQKDEEVEMLDNFPIIKGPNWLFKTKLIIMKKIGYNKFELNLNFEDNFDNSSLQFLENDSDSSSSLNNLNKYPNLKNDEKINDIKSGDYKSFKIIYDKEIGLYLLKNDQR